ncbi:MAG: hypothetical protein NTZ16_10620 [Verrucomicrobia bacterium]|nr:hypothetical protein [Verrucomicrobiota bacterium]
MSEFKYACPHCGQHIRCDTTQAGTTMECPTCFQKIIAPQAPASHDPKFILTGSKIPKHARPSGEERLATATAAPKKKFPIAAVGVVSLVVAVAVAAVVFRGKIFQRFSVKVVPYVEVTHGDKVVFHAPATNPPPAPSVAPAANDPNWKLDLAGVILPDAPAAGRLNGKEFFCQRASLLGGSLSLRQGNKWPPELGVIISLHAVHSADLAGKTIAVTTNLTAAPRVSLRWKDDQQQPATENFNGGYALRVEFGALAGERLPGKIYLCLPDEQKSYVAGSFTAEILKPKASTKTPKRKP